MPLRFTAVVPATLSLVVVALQIVLLVAGISPSSANQNYWLAVNTSSTGTGIVTVTPAAPGSNPNDTLGGIINSIPGLQPLASNITAGVGNALGDAQSQIIKSITKDVGVKDFYFLYAAKMCEGSKQAAAPGYTVDNCYPYSDAAQGLKKTVTSIPNSVTVANAQVSVPLIKTLSSTLSSVLDLGVGASTALMALLIVGVIAAGLTAIGSVLSFLRASSRLFTLVNLFFSAIAATVTTIVAVLITLIATAGSSIISSIGSGFDVNVKGSGPFLAIVWVATVMASNVSAYWFAVWFVEFRKTAFSRRSRKSNEIGNWRGMGGELIRDVKTDGHFAQSTGSELKLRGGGNYDDDLDPILENRRFPIAAVEGRPYRPFRKEDDQPEPARVV